MAVQAVRKILAQVGSPEAPMIGWIVGLETGRGAVVDFPGNTAGPVAARSTVALSAAGLEQAVANRQQVVLLFEQNDASLPIIIGLIQPVEAPAEKHELEMGTENFPEEVLLDGRRVTLEGYDEVQLKCGKASITLRRNGRVVIRGEQIVSHASGRNRIRGGAVEIN